MKIKFRVEYEISTQSYRVAAINTTTQTRCFEMTKSYTNRSDAMRALKRVVKMIKERVDITNIKSHFTDDLVY